MAIPQHVPANTPPRLKPGDWWLRYNGGQPIRFRPDGADERGAVMIHRGESFILPEADALKLLAFVQQQRPELVAAFVIVDREPEPIVTGGPDYARSRSSESARLARRYLATE